MWTFEIRTGRLLSPEKESAGYGYSGHDEGKNNPDMISVRWLGPIPVGVWRITGEPFFHTLGGPYTLRLEPAEGTETFDRSGFLIHGDKMKTPGDASHGCIVLPRSLRVEIWESGDHEINVVPGEQQEVA